MSIHQNYMALEPVAVFMVHHQHQPTIKSIVPLSNVQQINQVLHYPMEIQLVLVYIVVLLQLKLVHARVRLHKLIPHLSTHVTQNLTNFIQPQR